MALAWFLVWIAIASAAMYVSTIMPQALYAAAVCFLIGLIGMYWIERWRHP